MFKDRKLQLEDVRFIYMYVGFFLFCVNCFLDEMFHKYFAATDKKEMPSAYAYKGSLKSSQSWSASLSDKSSEAYRVAARDFENMVWKLDNILTNKQAKFFED